MIIVKYSGGLGNQMFQYANQVAMHVRYPNQVIKADLSHYNMWNEHNGFELSRTFGIELTKASLNEIRVLSNNFIATENMKYCPKWLRYLIAFKFQYVYRKFLNVIHPVKCKGIIHDGKYNQYNNQIESLEKGSWYVSGVWLNTKYFAKIKREIQSLFILESDLNNEDKKIADELRKGSAIAVHIRGGDFNNGNYDLCDSNYYSEAYSLFDLNLPLYVFTDDVDFAKRKLQGMNVSGFISHNVAESKIDMYMISLSKYIILSNSTFAFWGAFLSSNKQKVVSPKFARFDGEKYWKFPVEEDWDVIENIRR